MSYPVHLDIFFQMGRVIFPLTRYFVYSKRIKKLLTASAGIILMFSRVPCIEQSFQSFYVYFINFQ